MNGLTLLALLVLAIAVVVAWRMGVASGRRAERASTSTPLRPAVTAPAASQPASVAPAHATTSAAPVPAAREEAAVSPTAVAISAAPNPAPIATPAPASLNAALEAERARVVRSLVAENAALRAAHDDDAAALSHLRTLEAERRRMFVDLATARADTARYRTLVIDLENNAPPPLLDGPSAPDDLKLIVGVGPVLERMLQQMGITSYRQIARWSERDIDEFDARLAEFPGRIRRDAWVVQARALHQSKYGEALPVRDR